MGRVDTAKFALRRALALTAYRHRERKRDRKRFPTVWRNHFKLIAEDLRLVHEVSPELVDRDFLDDISAARVEVKKSTARQSALISICIAYMMLTAFGLTMPVTFSGFQFHETPGLMEIVAMAAAALSAAVAGKTVTMMSLTTASKALIPLVYPYETTYFRTIFHHPDEPSAPYLPKMMPGLVWKLGSMAASILVLLLIVVVLLLVLFGSIAWRWVAYSYIWNSPSIEPFWAHLSVILAISIDIAWLLFVMAYTIPLPYRDMRTLGAVEIAEQLGPDQLRRVNDQLYGEGTEDYLAMVEKGYLRPIQRK